MVHVKQPNWAVVIDDDETNGDDLTGATEPQRDHNLSIYSQASDGTNY